MSAQKRKSDSEKTIINTLIRTNPLDGTKPELSWSELLVQTGLSRRSLNLRLKDMEKRRLIMRRVDTSSGSYPPPVLYSLVQKNPIVSEILGRHYEYDRTVEKDLTFDESPEQFLEKLSAKISPIVVYALLKSIESSSDRPLDVFENLRFTIKKFLVYRQDFDQSDLKMLGQKFHDVDRNPEQFKTDIDSLVRVLKERFPNEVKQVERIFAKRRKLRVSRGPSLNPRGRPKKLARSNKEGAL